MRRAFLRSGAAAAVLAAASALRVVAQAPADLLYVCIQDEAKIAVVDMAAQAVVRSIDLTALGFSANAKPHHVVGEPDGSFWYVSLIGDNRVIKLDARDRVVGQLTMETPGMLALDRSWDLLLVSRSMSAVNPPRRVGLVRRSRFEVEEIDVFLPRPHPILVADNNFAYTGSMGENQLAAIDLESGLVDLTDIAGQPHALVQYAIPPDGRLMVATTELTGLLLVFDLSTPARPRFLRSIEVGPMAFDPVFAPDGRSVWIPIKGANEVAIVDAREWAVIGRIAHEALQRPHQIVFAPDGRTAFVSNNGAVQGTGHDMHAGGGAGSLVVLDVASRQVVKSIPLGVNVTGIGTRARD